MFIGLGGNTESTLEAFSRLRGLFADLLTPARFSSLYRTAPRDDVDQDEFWNAVAQGEWPGSSESLLERLLMLESELGRARDPRRPKGPRVIDLDLLLFGVEVSGTPRLGLPHPALGLRRFALEPLAELAPDLVDPRDGTPWLDRLALVPLQGVDRTDRPW